MPPKLKLSLNLVKGASHFFSGRLSVGAYVHGQKVILIDSGLEEAGAKDIDKTLKAQGLKPVAIINTHSHADHCGGNAYFKRQYPELEVFATKYEGVFIENPKMEPLCFCGGAEPHAELHNKFLEAEPSVVDYEIPAKDGAINIIEEEGKPPVAFQVVHLPGHTPGMVGVITPDNVFYCGDAIFNGETFDKHGVFFYTDIARTLESFDKIAKLKVDGCVFYHGAYEEDLDLAVVATKHKEKILATKAAIEEILSAGSISVDDLTAKVIKHFKVPESIMQFALTRTIVSAYVTQLQLEKRIALEMFEGKQVVKSLAPVAAKLVEAAAAKVFSFGEEMPVSSARIEADGQAVYFKFAERFAFCGDPHADMPALSTIDTLMNRLSDHISGPVSIKADKLSDKAAQAFYNDRPYRNKSFASATGEAKSSIELSDEGISVKSASFAGKNLRAILQSSGMKVEADAMGGSGMPLGGVVGAFSRSTAAQQPAAEPAM
ncbi:MAG: hypothetical protein K0S29_637 [Gammaproteobacteria bacterium]|jgi:glyoxylase-like metal-dependent hydrolase (beta-lactamase superfamily II)|nr:hypothetical protein [Gammaproteobacteria bacterium]